MSNLFKSKFLLGLMVAVFVVVGFAFTAEAAITKTLKMGMRDAQVMELQQWLNANGYTVSTTGAGSPGMESSYFGSKTKAAVMAFQSANGLVADGVVGPMTRAAMTSGTTVGGNTGGTFPAGCTSASGFSTVNGQPCSSGTTLPAGCLPGYMYSATTGQPCTGGSTTTQTGPLTAMLAMSNPASSTLVAGQATADLAHFAFNGSGTVTNVVLKRLGVSADSTPSNVYLFDGAMRLTDAASVANGGLVTFNNASGLFTVSGSKTIAVRSDIASGSSGQTVGFQLVSFTVSGGTAVTANLAGNIHTIATASLASVSSGTVTPTGATLNPGAGVTVWQSSLNVSTRDVLMKRVSFRNVGSAPASAFGGFKLYVNGVQVGTASTIDANGYVTFDFMSNPVTLASGTRVVRLDADIVSGASRTVQFALRQAADVDFVDSSFGVNITPSSTPNALPWQSASANNISGSAGGSLTIEKDNTSPSGNVAEGTNDQVLGVFKVTAFGEPMKIETLRATYAASDANIGSLRNGRIMINGVQYGSTATLNEDTQATPYTSFTLNYTVMPGTPVMVELRADLYDNDGTDSIDAAETIIGTIAAGSSNVQKVDSLGTISSPASAVAGNTLTFASTTATLTKNGTYANQTVVLPSTGFKVGSWNLAGSSTEDILLTTLSFDVEEVSGTEFDEGDLTNVYVVVKNGSTVVAQPSPIATLSAGGQDVNFSINYTLPKNGMVSIELFANLADDGLDGIGGSTEAIDSGDSFRADLTVTGTAMVSGAAVTSSEVQGQTIASGTASITATLDASTPVAANLYDNQTVTAGVYKFAAVTSAYDVTDVTIELDDATVIQTVELWDGGTMVASRPGASSVAFSGLAWNVPANTNKLLTVKIVLGPIGIGAGTSGVSQQVQLDGFTAVNKSTGVSAAGTGTNIDANAMYAFAAVPVIEQLALPSTAMQAGVNTIAKFKVTSNGGTIAWKELLLDINKSAAPTLSSVTLWDVTSGSTQVTAATLFQHDTNTDAACNASDTFCELLVTVGAKSDDNVEQQVSGSKTYEVRATIGGTLAADVYVSSTLTSNLTYVAPAIFDTAENDTTVNDATFVWSDVSAQSHDTGTADWSNEYLVTGIPTQTSWTLTY